MKRRTFTAGPMQLLGRSIAAPTLAARTDELGETRYSMAEDTKLIAADFAQQCAAAAAGAVREQIEQRRGRK